MKNHLKKPVHAALLKPTALDQLAKEGRLPAEEKPPLPRDEAPPKVFNPLSKLKSTGLLQQANKRVRLQVLHANAAPIPADRKPPCESCKASPCCKAFLVEITQLEYESGAYEEFAVELTPNVAKQLRTKGLLIPTLTAPQLTDGDGAKYFLEGKLWEACPFLGEDNKCTIYDTRPLTCRMYSCVGDDRITQEMRDGDVSGF